MASERTEVTENRLRAQTEIDNLIHGFCEQSIEIWAHANEVLEGYTVVLNPKGRSIISDKLFARVTHSDTLNSLHEQNGNPDYLYEQKTKNK